jgi:hypothetical protein
VEYLATRRFASDFPSLLSAPATEPPCIVTCAPRRQSNVQIQSFSTDSKKEELGEDRRATRKIGPILVGVWLAWRAVSRAQQATAAAPPEQAEELAKKLANPVSDLVSVPFQLNSEQRASSSCRKHVRAVTALSFDEILLENWLCTSIG